MDMKWKSTWLCIQAIASCNKAVDHGRNQWQGIVPCVIEGHAQEVMLQGMIFPPWFDSRETVGPQPRCNSECFVPRAKKSNVGTRGSKSPQNSTEGFLNLSVLRALVRSINVKAI